MTYNVFSGTLNPTRSVRFNTINLIFLACLGSLSRLPVLDYYTVGHKKGTNLFFSVTL